ncbi:reverse transcriptase [Caerostris extrusa]|uniref:Reverse transcriptase n=1 Tax=Caerostris extrusa TaxID=172846 RepID=A0AAV4X8W0_CAEEX|nr:reverse transcriptase [Caerostris extrusa]
MASSCCRKELDFPISRKRLDIISKKAVLEADNSAEATRMETNIESPKNSPPRSLLTKDEFVTVVKKEPSVDSTDNPNPVVPPLIIKKVKPTPPASHLPRAIADPRMAKLHDRRRPLVLSDANSKSIVERKKQSMQAKLSNLTNNFPVDDSGSSNSLNPQNHISKKHLKKKNPKVYLKNAGFQTKVMKRKRLCIVIEKVVWIMPHHLILMMLQMIMV